MNELLRRLLEIELRALGMLEKTGKRKRWSKKAGKEGGRNQISKEKTETGKRKEKKEVSQQEREKERQKGRKESQKNRQRKEGQAGRVGCLWGIYIN